MTASPKSPRAALERAAREHFYVFVALVFQELNPGRSYIQNWHILAACEEAMSFLEGTDAQLVVNMPPRTLKSVIYSVALPAFLLGQDPSRQIFCISLTGTLADKHHTDTRRVMASAWYQRVFPQTQVTRAVAEGIFTSAQGYRRTTTVFGTITGLGGDVFIVDDPLKPEDALSDAMRQSTNDWFGTTLASRANDKAAAKTLLVMQRLHPQDPSDLLLRRPRTRHLCLPAIADRDQTFSMPLDQRHFWRQGDLLDPTRLSQDALDMLRHEHGERGFSAQYLQAPVLIDGDLIRWSHFRLYDSAPDFQPGDEILQSWDTAMAETASADFSVGQTWLVRKGNFYLLDQIRQHLAYPDLKRRIGNEKAKYPQASILVEDKGSGMSVVQDLRRDLKGVIGVKVGDSKIVRANIASAKIEQREVFLPRHAPWLDTFKLECLAFPNGRNDDQVDAMSLAINWWNSKPRKPIALFGSY